MIQVSDPHGRTLLARHPQVEGDGLFVEEGQAAVVVVDGEVPASFGPGKHELPEDSLAAYFVSTVPFEDFKWGTAEPVTAGELAVRAYGSLKLRVVDVEPFVEEFGVRRELSTSEEAERALKGALLESLASVVESLPDAQAALTRESQEAGDYLRQATLSQFEGWGIELLDLSVGRFTVSG